VVSNECFGFSFCLAKYEVVVEKRQSMLWPRMPVPSGASATEGGPGAADHQQRRAAAAPAHLGNGRPNVECGGVLPA